MSQTKSDLKQKTVNTADIENPSNGDLSFPAWDTSSNSDVKASPKKSNSAKAGTTKAATSKSGTTKSGASKAGVSKTGTSKSGTSKAGASKTGTSKSGTTKTGTSKAGTTKAGTSKSGGSKTTAKSGTSKTGTSKTSASKTSTGKSGATKSAPKTSTAKSGASTTESAATKAVATNTTPTRPVSSSVGTSIEATTQARPSYNAGYPSFDAEKTAPTVITEIERPRPTSNYTRPRPTEAASGTPERRHSTSKKKEPNKAALGSLFARKSKTAKPEAAEKTPSRSDNKNTKKKKKRKHKHPILRAFFLLILCSMLLGGGAAFYFVYSVIAETPPIDPSNINDMLTETTVMYDAKGNEMDTIFSGTNREIASIQNMPKHLTDAFIALEDKTFRTHHGFNITRIIGALVEAVFGGGRISGTSTITQQLARNVFLQDTQFDYSIKRKIAEAYYSLKIEKTLSKDEIIEAYLNTIYFGYGSWGIETAAQAYFNKDVSQLTLAESAALASLPQLPNEYQFVEFIDGGTESQYPDIALKETDDGVYVVNDMSRERRRACLSLMLEQELITQAEYDQAINVELKDMLNPDFTTSYSLGYTSYFADYVISDVIKDLQAEKGLDYDSAWRTVYQGGLKIYSTMDPEAQRVIANEFSNQDNYPSVNPVFDGNGNAVNQDGVVLMFAYDNMFDENGNHIIPAENYDRLADGTMIIYYGRNLHIYETYVNDQVDYSLEFPAMYDYNENWEYSTIRGGYINIPMNYKSSNSDGDLIISADFFKDFPDFFIFNEDGTCSVPPSSYTLDQKTIQPQSAMTIVENKTGHIIAMVGGRTASGRQIYNRAIAPRQSGSSIKPLSVYSAALQQSVEEMRNGETHNFVNYGIDKQGAKKYGSYLTAASIVVDEKLTINGQTWPYNDNRQFSGVKTMRKALIDSINTCAVKIWMQVGVDYSIQNVKKFGITTLVEEGDTNDLNAAALALGGQTRGVNTLEMASAYTVFPNNGVRYEPSSYTKVIDRHGNVLLENNPEAQQVLDPGVAWIMTDMLRGVVLSGTGTRANFDTFVAGKTGTTDNEYDIWFDGFTNNYSASIWIGCDVNAKLGSMSSMAAALWGRIMSQLDGSYLGERAEMPSDVIKYNGEYFVDGTQKGAPSKDDLEKTVSLCKETNLLATPWCKDVEKKKFSTIDDEEEIKKLPKEYCYLHNNDPEKYPTTKEGMKHIEEETKKKEEKENKDAAEAVKAMIKALPANPGVADEAAVNAARAAYNKLTDAQKALVDDSKLVAAEQAVAAAKQAQNDAAAQEAARNAAYQKWLAERENHKHEITVIDVPYQDAVLYTQEEYDAYVTEHGSAPQWNVNDVKVPEVPEQSHTEWEYDPGWREGDFTYP